LEIALTPNFSIGLVYRLKQLAEARGFVDRPHALESRAELVELALGKEADSNNPVLRHTPSRHRDE
jgi:hypothetical protein